RRLAAAGLGERDAVIGTQTPDLTFEVRALLQEASGFIDEAVPDVDIGDAGLGGGFAVQRIQKQHVGGGLGPAHGGQPHPDDRHALRFQDGDHLVDFLVVELDPAIVVEFDYAVRCAASFRRYHLGNVAVVSGIVLRQLG